MYIHRMSFQNEGNVRTRYIMVFVPKSEKLFKYFYLITFVFGITTHVLYVFQYWNGILKLSKNRHGVSDAVYGNRGDRYDDFSMIEPYPMPGEVKPSDFGHALLRRTYSLLTTKTDVCKTPRNGTVELFILIMTKRNERSLRQAIRQTWLTYARNSTSNVRYVFLAATDGSSRLPEDFKYEIEMYQDIVVFDFKDSYENLTLKTTVGLKYAASHCGNARYVMKTDSDVYVNIPALVDYLVTNMTLAGSHTLGLLRLNGTPIRTSSGSQGKWAVSFREFPASEYPDYLDGMGYVLTMATVRALIDIFPSVKFFRFEDIYIGMCLWKLGIRLNHSNGILLFENYLTECFYKVRGVFAVHGISEQTALEIWNKNCTGRQDNSMRVAAPKFKWIKRASKDKQIDTA